MNASHEPWIFEPGLKDHFLAGSIGFEKLSQVSPPRRGFQLAERPRVSHRFDVEERFIQGIRQPLRVEQQPCERCVIIILRHSRRRQGEPRRREFRLKTCKESAEQIAADLFQDFRSIEPVKFHGLHVLLEV